MWFYYALVSRALLPAPPLVPYVEGPRCLQDTVSIPSLWGPGGDSACPKSREDVQEKCLLDTSGGIHSVYASPL